MTRKYKQNRSPNVEWLWVNCQLRIFPDVSFFLTYASTLAKSWKYSLERMSGTHLVQPLARIRTATDTVSGHPQICLAVSLKLFKSRDYETSAHLFLPYTYLLMKKVFHSDQNEWSKWVEAATSGHGSLVYCLLLLKRAWVNNPCNWPSSHCRMLLDHPVVLLGRSFHSSLRDYVDEEWWPF